MFIKYHTIKGMNKLTKFTVTNFKNSEKDIVMISLSNMYFLEIK